LLGYDRAALDALRRARHRQIGSRAHATLRPPEPSAIVPGHEIGMVHPNPRVPVSYASAFSDSARRPLQIVREHPRELRPPRLLNRVRQALRARHYSRRTEESYVAWIRRYIVFHGKRQD
jgi:hypothetical protein